MTDHSNLQFLHGSINRRVQHWAMMLSEYHFVVVYKPGRENAIADTLSRLLPEQRESVAVVRAGSTKRRNHY